MPFARITTTASVILLLTLTGCGHESTPTTAALPLAAPTDVPLEPVTEAPAGTESPVSTAKVSKATAPKAKVSKKPAHRASPSPTTPVIADVVMGSAVLDRFVTAVQRKLPEVALDRRDEEVEDLGEQACQALGNGRSATAAAGEVAEQGVTPADARTLVGLARDSLCRT